MINKNISISQINYEKSVVDLDALNMDIPLFRTALFEQYSKLGRKTAGIVDISDLRCEVASTLLLKSHVIVTEGTFDFLLRKLPFTTEYYSISLGRTMGSSEKLFKYKDNYFRTLYIEFVKGGQYENE